LTVLSDIPITLDIDRLAERYRIAPGSDHAQVFEELVARAQDVARPKALYEVCFIDEKGDDWVSVGGVRLASPALRKNLDQVERLFPYVATCGTEIDSLDIPPGDIRQKAWLFFLKGEFLQGAVAYLDEYVRRHHQIANLSSMNPGSGDATLWPLTEQAALFLLFGDVEGAIGVRLTESSLLIPEISISGVFFPTEADFESCQVCHRERCPTRRAPFSQEAWDALYEDLGVG